jgi:hypothetical protein
LFKRALLRRAQALRKAFRQGVDASSTRTAGVRGVNYFCGAADLIV